MTIIDSATRPFLDPLWGAGLLAYIILGLLLGSFASAISYRIPRGMPVFSSAARSACPKCNHTLGALDLVPLFSWLLNKGRCRYCCAKISIRYPVLEMSSAIAAALVYIFYSTNLQVEKVIVLLSVPFLISLVLIDLEHKILPNILVLIIAALGALKALTVYVGGTFHDPLLFFDIGIAALIYTAFAYILGLIMKVALKKDALGMGDVKFFGAAGIWLGVGGLPYFCVLSGVLGVVLGALWQKIKGERAFPFGPALIVSFFILLLFGSSHPL